MIPAPLSLSAQEDSGQWVVGKILEGAALDDKRVYQQMCSKWKRTAVDQLEEVS